MMFPPLPGIEIDWSIVFCSIVIPLFFSVVAKVREWQKRRRQPPELPSPNDITLSLGFFAKRCRFRWDSNVGWLNYETGLKVTTRELNDRLYGLSSVATERQTQREQAEKNVVYFKAQEAELRAKLAIEKAEARKTPYWAWLSKR